MIGYMSNLSSKDRLIENEVIFRDVNKNIQEFIEQEGLAKGKTVPFYCECSRPDCTQRINLTLKDYEKLHKDKKYFVTIVGHEFSEVEKVINKKNNYQLVEKHFIPPKAENIDLALKQINSSVSAA